MITVSQLINQSAARLERISETPFLDAQTLLGHNLGKTRAWLLTHPEENLSEAALTPFLLDLESLLEGIPLPYVLGHWEFFGLDFHVSPDTLIPRPETELLVEQAIDWITAWHKPCLVADIGTGSGCIAISIAWYSPDVHIIATDISIPALQVAHKNANAHGVAGRVNLINSDLFPPIIERFDLICANLPYIPTNTLQRLKISGKEPNFALDGGSDGLDYIARLINKLPDHAAKKGTALLEIDSSQGEKVCHLASRKIPSAEIKIMPDLSGKDRLLQIKLP